jgi:hypothetical protein
MVRDEALIRDVERVEPEARIAEVERTDRLPTAGAAGLAATSITKQPPAQVRGDVLEARDLGVLRREF